jgi:hypothetical protein
MKKKHLVTLDLESILKNFFHSKPDIFLFFSVKLGRYIAHALFAPKLNKGGNEEKPRLLGLTPDYHLKPILALYSQTQL